MPGRRYLVVKAHVGFGDRLQCLGHALQYAIKCGRAVCVDWRDSVWSDGAVDFGTYFDLCCVPTAPLAEVLAAPDRTVYPPAWAGQIDRPADSGLIYRPEYAGPLDDADRPEDVLVYPSVGFRTFHVTNLTLLRVAPAVREPIVRTLREYARFRTVVHLRGTDRVPPERHAEYVDAMCDRLAGADRDAPVLVVTDCLPLFERFQAAFPGAVLRTPGLAGLDPREAVHLRRGPDKHARNVELLTDFFLLTYAAACAHDPDTLFSKMARFLRCGDYKSILGYDPGGA